MLAIAGPTASGKSALAMRMAEALDAEIVNADALQVYSRLHVLTARPSETDLAHVPHHLYGHVDPSTAYSTGQWTREAMETIGEITERGKHALLVGGTGLYFRSLFNGIAHIPQPTETAQAKADALRDSGELLEEAQRLDPVATARLSAPDPQRLHRIVAVALGTEKPLSEWWADTTPLVSDYAALVVDIPREVLYRRIETRFDRMLDSGAMEEAQGLAHLDPKLPALKAIGVAHLLSAARGEMSIDEAIDLSRRDTRRLAKRQMTWFRNQHGHWPRVGWDANPDDVVSAFLQAEPQ